MRVPADSTSQLILGEDSQGSLVVGALYLHGGPLRVEGSVVDRWRLGSLHDVTATPTGKGSMLVPKGAMAFVGSAATSEGWVIDPFTVQYTAATGDVWTLESSALDFSLR